MAKRFEPEKIVDLNVDYYQILCLEKGCLPAFGPRTNNEDIAAILEKGWRKAARKAHPDYGGSEEAFLQVMRAHEILSNPLLRDYYESGGTIRPRQVGEGIHEIDMESVGTYVAGSLADTVGHNLFLQMQNHLDTLGVTPAYRPKSKYEAYEWDWVIHGVTKTEKTRTDIDKVTIAIVEDADDVFRLTSGDDIGESLPFKIYICIPRVFPRIRRTKDQKIIMDDGSEVIWQGSLRSAVYDDYELFSTTMIAAAEAYLFDGGLKADLELFRSGTLKKKKLDQDKSENQIGWMHKENVKHLDTEIYKQILKSKTWVLKPDPHAADFLENFPRENNEATATDTDV